LAHSFAHAVCEFALDNRGAFDLCYLSLWRVQSRETEFESQVRQSFEQLLRHCHFPTGPL
jgi:hypothetical protein